MTVAPAIRPGRRNGGSPRWALLRWFEIPDSIDPSRVYLRRLRVVTTPWFGVYLHWIFLPDRDRYPHDHPWSFVSLVLRGGYIERIHSKLLPGLGHVVTQRRARWSIHRMTTGVAHMITVLEPGTITLVVTGPRRREWGFWTPGGWVNWRDYTWDQDEAV